LRNERFFFLFAELLKNGEGLADNNRLKLERMKDGILVFEKTRFVELRILDNDSDEPFFLSKFNDFYRFIEGREVSSLPVIKERQLIKRGMMA